MSRQAKWDARFMALCRHIGSEWSKDPIRRVGAVLVKEINRDPILGYNGFPRGTRDTTERLENRDLKRKLVIHAERNAILCAKRDLAGYTLYSSMKPCIACTCDIIQAEISTVVYPKLTQEIRRVHESYLEGWELVDELLKEASITVREI